MSFHYSESEARTIRHFVREQKRHREAARLHRLAEARRDFEAILALVVRLGKPLRVYQWGSLIDGRHFSEMSDIDLALEGVTDPAVLSELRRQAERLTRIPLDMVSIEHVHPAYAEFIRRRGRIVYER